MAVQSDGKAILVGMADYVWMTSGDFGIVRYNTNGSLDTGFDSDGIVTTDISGSGSLDIAYAVQVDATGKIVVAGWTNNSTSNDYSDFGLARYNTNGTLDTTFGTAGTGKVITDIYSDGNMANAMALMSDDKIAVAGHNFNHDFSDASADFAVMRYNANGTMDSTFAGTGRLQTDFGYRDAAYAIAVDANGCLIIAGLTNNHAATGYGEDFALLRLLASV